MVLSLLLHVLLHLPELSHHVVFHAAKGPLSYSSVIDLRYAFSRLSLLFFRLLSILGFSIFSCIAFLFLFFSFLSSFDLSLDLIKDLSFAENALFMGQFFGQKLFETILGARPILCHLICGLLLKTTQLSVDVVQNDLCDLNL